MIWRPTPLGAPLADTRSRPAEPVRRIYGIDVPGRGWKTMNVASCRSTAATSRGSRSFRICVTPSSTAFRPRGAARLRQERSTPNQSPPARRARGRARPCHITSAGGVALLIRTGADPRPGLVAVGVVRRQPSRPLEFGRLGGHSGYRGERCAAHIGRVAEIAPGGGKRALEQDRP